jgi:magnesium transporter
MIAHRIAIGTARTTYTVPGDTTRFAVAVQGTSEDDMQLFWRRHTPGTAPGTLAEGEPPLEPIRMRLARYNLETLHESELESPQNLPQPEAGKSLWLDVEGHDVDVISELGRRLSIHPLALEDVINVGQRPKVEEFENSLFGVVDHFFIDQETGDLVKDQISLVLQPDLLLSVRERRSELFEPVRARLRGGRPRIRGGGPSYLAYALLDTAVDHLFPVLEGIGDRLEEIESSLLDTPTANDLGALHLLKRDLLLLRRSLWPLRDMLNGMQRGDSDLISDEARLYLRDVADHATMAVDIVETLREMVSSLMDLYLSSVSNRMNEVMKVLTIIATIFIPLSFIAGLYGMNFDPGVSPFNMPELGWYWGYPVALVVMAAVAAALLVYFRRRGWI